jgi:hypothetical protein
MVQFAPQKRKRLAEARALDHSEARTEFRYVGRGTLTLRAARAPNLFKPEYHRIW